MTMTLKEINKNINWIKTTGVKFDAKLHDTAVAIIEHARDHGDHSAYNRLREALAGSVRKTAMDVWFTHFTPTRIDPKLNVCLKAKRSTQIWDVEGASAVKFWDFSDEMVKVVDVDKIANLTNVEIIAKYYEQQQTRLDNAIEGGKVKGDVQAAHARLAG